MYLLSQKINHFGFPMPIELLIFGFPIPIELLIFVFPIPIESLMFGSSMPMELFKLRSSRSASNRPLRATCTKTAAHTWHLDAIWTLLLFWPTVARSGRLDADLDERSFNYIYITSMM